MDEINFKTISVTHILMFYNIDDTVKNIDKVENVNITQTFKYT